MQNVATNALLRRISGKVILIGNGTKRAVDKKVMNPSNVIQMLRNGFRVAVYFGQDLFVLECYFLIIPLLRKWQKESRQHPGLIHVVTRAKKNCIAYAYRFKIETMREFNQQFSSLFYHLE